MNDSRLQALTQWCRQHLSDKDMQLEVVSSDASFRRYFRTYQKEDSCPSTKFIAVDAPPDKENSEPFVLIAQALHEKGILVPEIHHHDLDQGFMLIEDFGDSLLLDELNDLSVNSHYQSALNSLFKLKDCDKLNNYLLPPYDRQLLLSEMSLFLEWFLIAHLGHNEGNLLVDNLDSIFNTLIDSALEQPQVFVHLDYHSRNLLLLNTGEIGIIDFQDAVTGPVTYDPVSLLKDCYIAWPREKVLTWLESYYNDLVTQQLFGLGDFKQFTRWFDFMGMQRHLKAVGIFARLYHRDNKPEYLNDIPRTLDYLLECCLIYPEFESFGQSIKKIRSNL